MLLPLHAGYLAKSGVAWSPEEEYRAEDSALKKFVQKMAATAVVLSGAPTPAGTSVFSKHNWDMGMGYLWVNGWGIYHLMGWTFNGGTFIYHLMGGAFVT